MNIPFDTVKVKGPVIYAPLSTTANVNRVQAFIHEEFVRYVGEALAILQSEFVETSTCLFVSSKMFSVSSLLEGPGSFDFDGAWLVNYDVGIHLLQSENLESMRKKKLTPRMIISLFRFMLFLLSHTNNILKFSDI